MHVCSYFLEKIIAAFEIEDFVETHIFQLWVMFALWRQKNDAADAVRAGMYTRVRVEPRLH